MSSEAFWERMAEVDKALGRQPASADERAYTDAMAGRIVTVTEAVRAWDSPGLYENEGARTRCLDVLKAHRFVGTDNLRYHYADWDLVTQARSEPYFLPPFDPDDPNQAAVPRVIFGSNPASVRICRGTVYDSLAGVLLSIAAKPSWLCDWGGFTGNEDRKPGPHPIKPMISTDPATGDRQTTHSLPYLLLKAIGDYLLVFVVCTQCLEDVIHRGRLEWTYGPNDRDREYIDGHWKPRFYKQSPGSMPVWTSNDGLLPSEDFGPAAYLINGIRFVVPHRYSQWREFDDRTYDYLPD
jgi:hypothetical protein